MKKKLLLLTILFFQIIFRNYSVAQIWTRLSPQPSEQATVAISFINDNEGWKYDVTNKLYHTSNGGNVWTYVSQYDSAFTDMQFVDAQTAYAFGRNGTLIYKTTNAGTNWSKINVPTGSKSLWTIQFTDPQHGWVMPTYATDSIYYTTDGGAHWNAGVTPSITKNWGEAFSFVNNSDGWAINHYGEIFKTINGGVSWTSVYYNSNAIYYLYSINFISPTVGFASGQDIVAADYKIYKTTDGGASWNVVKSTDDAGIQFAFNGTQHGILESYYGNEYWITHDGGQTWTDTSLINASSAISDICSSGNQSFFACTITGDEYVSTNNGVSFTNRETRIYNYDTYALRFADSLNGFSVNSSGGIYRTTDGGVNWNTFPIAVSKAPGLYDLCFNDLDHIWTEGSMTGGTEIDHTADGGLNWSRDTIPNFFATCIRMHDNLHGFTAGSSGKIYSTVNGGASWTNSYSGTSSFRFLKIFTLDSMHTWVLGGYYNNPQVIEITTNGGSTWTQVTLPNEYYYYSQPFFINVLEGWMGGGNKLIHTTDGGLTWSTITIPTGGQDVGFYQIKFTDNKHGLAIGGAHGKYITRTSDGGITWTPELVQLPSLPFDGGFILDGNHAWAFGIKGILYRLSQSGPNGVENYSSGYSVNIYPNPATNEFQITGLTFSEGDEINIVDETGKVVEKKIITYPGKVEMISTQNLKNGIYLVQIISGKRSFSQKLVVQH